MHIFFATKMDIQPIRIYSDGERKDEPTQQPLQINPQIDDEIVLPRPASNENIPDEKCELEDPEEVFDVDVNDEKIEECPPKKNALLGSYRLDVTDKNKSSSIPLVYIGMALGLIRFLA